MPNGRCRLHGGKSLHGIAHPGFKDGKRSKYMPKFLSEAFTRAALDPDLLNLTESIATVEALAADLLSSMSDDEKSNAGIVERLQATEETKRKLIETEIKRREKARKLVPIEYALWHASQTAIATAQAIRGRKDIDRVVQEEVIRDIVRIYDQQFGNLLSLPELGESAD
jgi:hypothetical protein